MTIGDQQFDLGKSATGSQGGEITYHDNFALSYCCESASFGPWLCN